MILIRKGRGSRNLNIASHAFQSEVQLCRLSSSSPSLDQRILLPLVIFLKTWIRNLNATPNADQTLLIGLYFKLNKPMLPKPPVWPQHCLSMGFGQYIIWSMFLQKVAQCVSPSPFFCKKEICTANKYQQQTVERILAVIAWQTFHLNWSNLLQLRYSI